jgi:hypothetical protein
VLIDNKENQKTVDDPCDDISNNVSEWIRAKVRK